ncbi:hypothetical protein Q0M94_10195 [Deinococcus radiomollis]|uniref:DinB family protein n=1 Tax=Deinococcus radiomollis TaxID=468916 RepID=UPI0038915779
MNRLVSQKANLFDLTHSLRDSVLGALQDADLSFRPGGDTLNFSRLLLEQGEIQAAYTRLFQTSELKLDVTAPAGLDTVAELQAWFTGLDAEMWSALEVLSNDDLDRPIVRSGHAMPLGVTFYTYRESVFIFAAKASVYLRSLGHEVPTLVLSFVG